MEITYKIEVFEGPIDLLLSLIYKNKIDIHDIPISLICEQYMAYIDEMKELDINIAGEFLVMASELMLIKSRMLLPKPEGEDGGEDPRTPLANMIIEYKHAKEIAEELDGWIKIYGGRMAKDTDEIPADDSFIADHSVQLLKRAMSRLLLNESRREMLEKEAERARPVVKVRPSVTSKVIGVLKKLLRRGKTEFGEFFEDCGSRSDIVAVFLSILELLKVNRISVSGGEEGEKIYIELNKDQKKQEEGT